MTPHFCARCGSDHPHYVEQNSGPGRTLWLCHTCAPAVRTRTSTTASENAA
ncbi:hypothetical protein [Streptomyces sp. ODS28]|uniref:hypothetical protein n=1 Tax=Streptomyces sp. ODS28 TaxID=3136688 RepID=UPI0031E7C4D6